MRLWEHEHLFVVKHSIEQMFAFWLHPSYIDKQMFDRTGGASGEGG